MPLVIEDPDDPASQAIRQVARGLIAMAPAKPVELPLLPLVVSAAEAQLTPAGIAPAGAAPAPADSAKPVGMSLPMA